MTICCQGWIRDVGSGCCRRGKSVDFASDGSELIELIGNKFYDVLLTDLQYAGIEGFAIASKYPKTHAHMPYSCYQR